MYVIVPYIWFGTERPRIVKIIFCRECKTSNSGQAQVRRKDSYNDSDTLKFFFGWALEDYKEDLDGWEIWNVMNRTVIITGSVVMFSENRFSLHFIIMSWSLLLHVRWYPYADKETNILAILFCLCDLLGALAAFYTVIQPIFIFSTLMTLIIVGVLATRAVCEQAKKSKTRLKNQSTKDLFSSYTSLEKKLLFPVLVVVWISVRLFHLIHCSRTKGVNQGNGMTTTKVVDSKSGNNLEEKISQGILDDDILSWGRGSINIDGNNKTKITPMLQQGVAMGTLMPQGAVIKERVEERLPDVFYVGDVVWFQRSKKPQRAEIIEVVPVDLTMGVTSAASIQGYMISFLSSKKASKIKFTLPEYIRLEEVEEVNNMHEKRRLAAATVVPRVQEQTTTVAVEEEKSTVISEMKIVPSEAASPVPRRKPKLVISDSDSD